MEHWSLRALPPFPKSSRKEAAGVPPSLSSLALVGSLLMAGDSGKLHFWFLLVLR